MSIWTYSKIAGIVEKQVEFKVQEPLYAITDHWDGCNAAAVAPDYVYYVIKDITSNTWYHVQGSIEEYYECMDI